MLNGLKSIFDDISVNSYEEILNSMICSEPSINCYFKECNICPGFSEIATEIKEALNKKNIININYQQWTNTDRTTIESVTKETETFVQEMSKEAYVLLVHNFIAKEQSQFLKTLKQI